MREFIVSEDFHPEVRGYAELVRCKDCKYWEQYSDVPQIGNCPVLDRNERDNWFCANGERKDSEADEVQGNRERQTLPMGRFTRF